MSLPRPRIREAYKQYRPPLNVPRVMRRLLAAVPPTYLAGLNEIVLTNAAILSRAQRRREWTSARSRLPEIRGLYCQSVSDQPARIEIFVDNVLKEWPPLLLQIPFFRNFAFAEVLYYELGYHIQATVKPEFRDREKLAEQCAAKFFALFFRRQYWYLPPLGTPVRAGVRAVKKLLGTRENGLVGGRE